jgi:ketosteroid isomerase-like protein
MHLVFIAAILVGGASIADAQVKDQAPTETATIEAVQAFQAELFGAMQKRDRAALERLIADGFVFVHSTGGLEERKRFIDNAVAGSLSSQTESPQMFDRQLRVFGGHTALQTSRSVRDKGRPTEVNLRTLQIYVKLDGRWQWLSGQSVRLPSRPASVTLDPRVYEEHVGQYAIGENRMFTVSRDGDILRGRTNARGGELVPKSATEFIWFDAENNADAQIIFLADQSGGVTHAVFRRDGQEVWRAQKIK